MIALDRPMPLNCSVCPLFRLIGIIMANPRCRAASINLEEIDYWNDRHKDCPLIEIEEELR